MNPHALSTAINNFDTNLEWWEQPMLTGWTATLRQGRLPGVGAGAGIIAGGAV
jgi:hypothetical protein